MKKGVLFGLLVFVLVALPLFGACAEPAPAPTPAPAPEAPAPAPPEKIEIIFTDNNPPMAGGNVLWHEGYVPRLKEMLGPELGDRIEFVWYHAESLFPYGDQVNAVEQGLADITYWVNSYETERAPLNEFTDIPFMGWPSTGVATAVWDAVSYSLPEVAAEYEGFEVLGRWNGLKRVIAMNGPAKMPADFKGKKIIASGTAGKIFQSLGASPIQQPPSEWATSLDRGLADGVVSGYFMFFLFGIVEVTNFVTDFSGGDMGYGGSNWVMNKEKFMSLPPEMQGAMKALRPWVTANMVATDAQEMAKGKQACIDAGFTVSTYTPEEMQEWFDAAMPLHQKWIEEGESEGIPRQMVYDEAKKWIEIYRTGLLPAGTGSAGH